MLTVGNRLSPRLHSMPKPWRSVRARLAGLARNPSRFASIELFSTLSPRELDGISSSLSTRKYLAGEVVFDIGEIGQAIYFVLEGVVAIRREDASDATVLTRVSPSSAFGALALLLDEPREVQAIADTDCELAVLFRADLQALFETHARVGSKLSHALALHFARILHKRVLHDHYPDFL